MTAEVERLTFAGWVTGIRQELEAAGYEVRIHAGFPLVTKPTDMAGTIALLEWSSPSGLRCCKSIYAEGMLVTPEPVNRGR